MTDLDLRHRTIGIYIYISVVEKMKIILLNSLVYAAIYFMCTKGLKKGLCKKEISVCCHLTKPGQIATQIKLCVNYFDSLLLFFFVYFYKIQLVSNLIQYPVLFLSLENLFILSATIKHVHTLVFLN